MAHAHTKPGDECRVRAAGERARNVLLLMPPESSSTSSSSSSLFNAGATQLPE